MIEKTAAPQSEDIRRCTVASYSQRAFAIAAKRRVLSTFRVHVAVEHCAVCDKFHLDHVGKPVFMEHWLDILKYVAQGLHDTEIGPLVGLTPRTVERNIGVMSQRFYALSRANLVAITIALGIIDPNDFVPAERERFHA